MPQIVPTHVLKSIIKIERTFLWARTAKVMGGKCKVAWSSVCSLVEKGGLGVLDLRRFSLALRLRWFWLTWPHPANPWMTFPLPCDQNGQDAFMRATKVVIDNARTTSF